MATRARDYYEVLGVPRTASQKEIKSAFRRLARKHHPDVNPDDPQAVERFKEINEAHEVLADPEKRQRYDRYGSAREGPPEGGQRPGGAAGAQTGNVEYRTVSAEDLEDMFGSDSPFSDFFHDMFGRGRDGGARSSRGGGAQAVAMPGADVEGEISLTLEEAYRGTTRTFELQTGNQTRRVEVKVPPGIREGARLRVAGQGSPGRGGGPAGDLYVRIKVLPHPVFRREGDDLYARVQVPLDVALLGGEVMVPTLKGTAVSLKIPAGVQNGAKLRLRGLGMPRSKGEGYGDLYAEVDVRLPEQVTPEVRALAEALRRARTGREG